MVTLIQEQAIQLIQQLPDEKIRAIITLAADEIKLMELKQQENTSRKKQAYTDLENLHLDFPKDFDADAELQEFLSRVYDKAAAHPSCRFSL